ncbi:MAG: tRNA-dihydrouridine synthase family protein [Clostridia bacterium]|nr:tRNA-dihydrouridine synthase family protein [Clostridia bacterium]
MKIYFAPMEGITDGVMRRIHRDIFGGVDIYCLPFHKLTQSVTLTTREKRDIDPEENRGISVLPQALTKEPKQLLIWLEHIAGMGYRYADLNLGCPSPTVTKRGKGSGLLRDTGLLQSFLDDVFSRPLPTALSVKTRIGYESAEEWPRLLEILTQYPFAHMTIHVRTMKEQYIGGIHPEAFGEAVRAGIQHPVYNGDLRSVADVENLLQRFPKTEAVMIGRGLLANPALARQLQGGEEASRAELETWYMALYEGWKDRFHATIALGRIKKLMEWTIGGDIRRKRLLKRADGIEDCVRAILDNPRTL